MEQAIINIGNWVFSGFWHFIGVVWILRIVFDWTPFQLKIVHKVNSDFEKLLKELKK